MEEGGEDGRRRKIGHIIHESDWRTILDVVCLFIV